MQVIANWLKVVLALGFVVGLGAFVLKPTPAPAAQRKTVVVELFTSEGCSSCPPADALLAQLEQGASANGVQIIPLGFHVDYWDSQGWRDRFSSHLYTQRQETYAARFRLNSPYTPQMVVDGQSEFVGNDSGRIQQAIAQAAAQPAQVDVQLSWKIPGRLLVQAASGAGVESGEVLLAVTEDNLSSNVGAGENQGHVLHHAAVVRDFRHLGQLSKGQFQTELTVKAAKDWKPKDLRVTVFIQNARGGPIEGAATLPFAD
jgi:hypothetical protein